MLVGKTMSPPNENNMFLMSAIGDAELEPTRAVLEPTGAVLEPTGAVLEPTGVAPEPTGAVLEPTGAVLEPRRARAGQRLPRRPKAFEAPTGPTGE